jgi:hypothetical protein
MRRAARPEAALAALFFLAATVLFTWPMASRAREGLVDVWDAKLNAWILHWDYHQIFHDPVHLYDANIFFPARYALAFSENLVGAALFAFPLYAVGVSTLTAYNVIFLLGMFLSGLAAWALARDATGDGLTAIVAGMVFAFSPWRISQIPHIQFQWGAFLALSLLFLLRYLESGSRRDAVLFGICFAWNALCNVHYAIFSGFLIGVALFVEGLVIGWSVFRPRLLGAAAAMAVAGVVVLPFFVPYALASRLYGMSRGYSEIETYSGVWTDFLSAGEKNKPYASLTKRWGKPEGDFFPGVTAIALATAALVQRRRIERRLDLRQASPARRRTALWLDIPLLLAIGLWIFARTGHGSLGPLKVREPGRIAVVVAALLILRLAAAFPRWSRFSDLSDFLRRGRFGPRVALFAAICLVGVVVALGTHTPFYRLLVQSFGPVFRVIRGPARGIVLFDLALGVLAAFGLAGLVRGRDPRVRLAVTAAAALLVGIEYRAFPLVVAPVDREAPQAERFLSTLTFGGGVVEWPLSLADDFEHEFRSTAHWKPILNGFSGFWPPAYDELARATAEAPMPDRIWRMLEERRAALLVFHPDEVRDQAKKNYAEALLRGVEKRALIPIGSFEHDGDRDLLFRVASAGPMALPADPDPSATQAAVLRLGLVRHPPFGFIDVPAEDAVVASGSWAFGWALAESGVARVVVSFDAGPGFDVPYGQPHPGPARVHSGYPDSARAGFGFAIPPLPAGRHLLKVMLDARDGGRAEMSRNIQIR